MSKPEIEIYLLLCDEFPHIFMFKSKDLFESPFDVPMDTDSRRRLIER